MKGFFQVYAMDARVEAVRDERAEALRAARPDCCSRSVKDACWRRSPWYAFRLAFGR